MMLCYEFVVAIVVRVGCLLCVGVIQKQIKHEGSRRFYGPESEGCVQIVHLSLMVNVLSCRRLRFTLAGTP